MTDNDVVNVALMRAQATALSEIRPLGRVVRASAVSTADVAGTGCVAFLWAYAVIHVAHERGFDPAAARAISSIPLFSTFVLALAVAALSSIAASVVVALTGRRLRATPRLLATSIGLFGAAMILFP
jgi:hypothetical protein